MKPMEMGMMTLALLGASAAQATPVCDKTTYDTSFKKREPVSEPPELIAAPPRIVEGGKINCSMDRDLLKNINVLHRIEEGSLKNAKYRIYYLDGSGSVQGLRENTLDYLKDNSSTNWSTRCKVDSMDDSHWCAMSKGPLTIGIWGSGTYFITIGQDHFPGSEVMLRADKNTPIGKKADITFTAEQTETIIGQLKSATMVTTRYREWPYEIDKDKKIDLYGFNQGLEIITILFNKANVQ